MKVSELMAGYTPSPDFAGVETADQWVAAFEIGEATSPCDYIVVEGGINAVTPTFNPTTSDKQYLRKGNVSTKTGNQLILAIEGDTTQGDDFQAHCMNADVAFGVGEEVAGHYVYFSLNTGKGYQGNGMLIVNNFGGGPAGENAPFSAEIRSTERPQEYTYSAEV